LFGCVTPADHALTGLSSFVSGGRTPGIYRLLCCVRFDDAPAKIVRALSRYKDVDDRAIASGNASSINDLLFRTRPTVSNPHRNGVTLQSRRILMTIDC